MAAQFNLFCFMTSEIYESVKLQDTVNNSKADNVVDKVFLSNLRGRTVFSNLSNLIDSIDGSPFNVRRFEPCRHNNASLNAYVTGNIMKQNKKAEYFKAS